MKGRRHHNNKGERQIKRGKTHFSVAAMAKRLDIPYTVGKANDEAVRGEAPDWETKGRKRSAQEFFNKPTLDK